MTRKWGKFKDAHGRHHWLRMDQIAGVEAPRVGEDAGMPTTIVTDSGRSMQVYGCNTHRLVLDLTTIDKRAALTDYTGGTP